MVNKKEANKKTEEAEKKLNLKLVGLIVSIVMFLSVLSYFNIYKENNIINSQTYDIIRQSESNAKYDFLAEKEYSSNLNTILNPLLKIFNYQTAINIMLIIIFLISIFIIRNCTEKESIVLLIIPFSPFFLQYFLILNDYTLSIFFGLISLFIISKNKYTTSLPFFLISLFFNPSIGITLFAIIITYIIKSQNSEAKQSNKYKLLFLLYLIPIAIGILWKYNPIIITTGSFVELNSIYGISITMLLVSLIGYNKFKKNPYIWISIWFSLGIIFIDKIAGLIIINLVLIYTAATTIKTIIGETWHNTNLKKLTVLLLFCTIVFSNLLHLTHIDKNQANSEVIETLSSFSNNNAKIILSSEENGYIIKFFSNKSIILDPDMALVKNSYQKQKIATQIFQSRNLEATEILLNKNNISHIIFTKDMLESQEASNKYSGILFLIDVYKDNFKTFYENDHILIYRYKKSN